MESWEAKLTRRVEFKESSLEEYPVVTCPECEHIITAEQLLYQLLSSTQPPHCPQCGSQLPEEEVNHG